MQAVANPSGCRGSKAAGSRPGLKRDSHRASTAHLVAGSKAPGSRPGLKRQPLRCRLLSDAGYEAPGSRPGLKQILVFFAKRLVDGLQGPWFPSGIETNERN